MIRGICHSIVAVSLALASAAVGRGQVQYPLTGATVQNVRDWNRHAQSFAAREADLDRVEISVLGEDGQERKVSVGHSKGAVGLLRDSLAHLKDLDDLYLGKPEVFTNNLKCTFVFRKHNGRPAETWRWRVYWLALPQNEARLEPNRPALDPLFHRLLHLAE